jgi:hypothetical protein
MAKQFRFILPIILIIVVFTPIVFWHYGTEVPETPLFFGVSFGGKTAVEAELLIDKVKLYTNFFLVNSYDLSINETELNEVCDYAAEANLHFMVYFGWISRVTYPWHQTWLDVAKQRWGDKFLGVYLYDEPGGKQLDIPNGSEEMRVVLGNVSDYSDAASSFVKNYSSVNGMPDLRKRHIPVFTSDYALYWFDYLAGYDTVFVELAWNNSKIQQIGLCRGAANVQGKDWGAIITWTYDNPPYLANGSKIYEDMLTAFETGAKYVIVFNFPTCPEDNPYGILREEHFVAMQQFWNHIHEYPEDYGREKGQFAFVLPKDYGWGMRRPNDSIWGLWPADNLSSVIWNKMNILGERYGFQLDIVYDESRYNFSQYSKVYYWNSSLGEE